MEAGASLLDDVAACIRGLPRRLKIGPYDWKVVTLDDEHELCGQAVFAEDHLKLWPEMLTSPSHAVGIVLHECLHVIFDNQKLGLVKGSKDAREEAIVDGFETGLISLLRDNPKLFNWMRKWLK